MKKQASSVEEALTRQVAEILPGKEGLASLMQKKKIRVYLGVDPTSPNLHLGHAALLRKLRQFQELGHEVILLFGTFTAQIGDPSGRDKAREPLAPAEIKKNMATYVKQAAFALDVKKITIKHNGDWLGKMKFKDVLELASHMTVSRLLERDMFQARIARKEEVWAHELLYPLMQGYDSVAMDVDLEIGGTDQTFNMLVGRKLAQDYKKKEKYVMTLPLLLGPDGRKMSKSLGNVINLLDSPQDMFGKIMAVKDELIPHYFELCTDASKEEIADIKTRIQQGGLNLFDTKLDLAFRIVFNYYPKKARSAQEEFSYVYQKKEGYPSQIDIVSIKTIQTTSLPPADLLIILKLASSKSEAKRLIEQGGMKIDRIAIKNNETPIMIRPGMVVQAGKKRFKKIGE